jgi:uncharacterized membrane protein
MAGLAAAWMVILVVLGIVLVVRWIILPFAILGTKHRLNLILDEQRRTNALLSALAARRGGQPGAAKT